MKKSLKYSMFKYYDERAKEYDEIYTLGKGPASINDPRVYMEETKTLQRIVNRVCRGKLLDIPCGTAFWLTSYAEKCSSVHLFDQSDNMLDQAKLKALQAGIADRCSYFVGDLLENDWESSSYESILTGFFISHLTDDQEDIFFKKIIQALAPAGRFLILDSVWGDTRAATRRKSGEQKRRLSDGSEFRIYKKYFDRTDIEKIGKKYGLKTDIHFFGNTFCAFSGRI